MHLGDATGLADCTSRVRTSAAAKVEDEGLACSSSGLFSMYSSGASPNGTSGICAVTENNPCDMPMAGRVQTRPHHHYHINPAKFHYYHPYHLHCARNASRQPSYRRTTTIWFWFISHINHHVDGHCLHQLHHQHRRKRFQRQKGWYCGSSHRCASAACCRGCSSLPGTNEAAATRCTSGSSSSRGR